MVKVKKAKKVVETPIVETPVEGTIETPSAVVPVGESTAKKELRKLIEVYKKQSPAKYELKKAFLDKQLDEIDSPKE